MTDELVAIVGAEHVITSVDGVDPYLADITEHPRGRADVVVRPGSRDEVVAIVEAAAASGTPITPIVAGYNVAGIAIPRDGGIVLDLTRLQGIEVDRDAMVVVVEPGVTFEQLKAHLDRECPELVYTYPFAPPFTSVMANALLDGLNNLSMRHGAMGKWITGVEAVLADGTVVRTGSGAVVDSWFGRAPLPDLTGLFVSTQGTTGIVLRAGLALVPRPAHRRRWFAFAWSLADAYAAMRELARTGSFDDVGLMTWPAAKLLFGATEGFVRADDEPLAFLFIDITGASAAELVARLQLGREILDGAGIDSVFEVEQLVKMLPGMAKLAELPTTLDFLLDFPGGGLAWVGSYGPGRSWVAGRHRRHGDPRGPRLPAVPGRPPDGRRPLLRAAVRRLLRSRRSVRRRAHREVHGRTRRLRARSRLRAVQGVGSRGRADRGPRRPGLRRAAHACATRSTLIVE